jgi:UDP-glucuronate 4-epimerase
VPPGPEGRGAAFSGVWLSPVAPWGVVIIGESQPRRLDEFIAELETALGRMAERRLMDLQPGDVPATWADTTLLTALIGALPATRMEDGLREFVAWYLASEHNREAG